MAPILAERDTVRSVAVPNVPAVVAGLPELQFRRPDRVELPARIVAAISSRPFRDVRDVAKCQPSSSMFFRISILAEGWPVPSAVARLHACGCGKRLSCAPA